MNRKSESDNAWKLDFTTLSDEHATDSKANLVTANSASRQNPHEPEIASESADYQRRYD